LVEFEDEEDFYEIMNNINAFNSNQLQVYSIDRDAPTVVFVEEPPMIAEHMVQQDDNNYSETDTINESDEDVL